MAQAQAHDIRVAGGSFGPGRHYLKVPVTTDLNGGLVALATHVVVGHRPGPRLLVSSTLHGGEWSTIEVIRRLLGRLDPKEMAGSLVALPVGNPTAFGQMKRATPDESDNSDLNRVFPGHEAWITEQLAATITRELLPGVDAVIDFHQGGWGSNFGRISYGKDFPAGVMERSRELAYAFGFQLVRAQTTRRFPGPGSLMGYVGLELGVPSIIGGIGGMGFEHESEEGWLEANVEGVLGVMRHLGILAGAPRRVPVLEFSRMTRVNPTIGGFLYPRLEGADLGREVAAGEFLADVVSPYTREVLETLTAPEDGYLMYYPRWYPVRPGDWAYGLVPKHDPGTHWVEPHRQGVTA